MKHKFPVLFARSGLLILFLALMISLPLMGCSKKHKSSRGAVPATGTPGGTGTGTGTGTGGGGNGGGGNPGDANELDLSWTVKEDTSQADMEYMVGRIKTYANNFWIGCEGQAYLRDQTLSCGSSGGNVVIDSVKGPMKQPPAMCSFGGGQWTIWLSTGEIASHGFLHEIGHGWVGPFSSEEYNCMNQSAGVCIMAAMYGGGEGFNKWCDTENCVSHQECWTKIQATHSWAHPGPGGTSPTCNVTIQ